MRSRCTQIRQPPAYRLRPTASLFRLPLPPLKKPTCVDTAPTVEHSSRRQHRRVHPEQARRVSAKLQPQQERRSMHSVHEMPAQARPHRTHHNRRTNAKSLIPSAAKQRPHDHPTRRCQPQGANDDLHKIPRESGRHHAARGHRRRQYQQRAHAEAKSRPRRRTRSMPRFGGKGRRLIFGRVHRTHSTTALATLRLPSNALARGSLLPCRAACRRRRPPGPSRGRGRLPIATSHPPRE